ncbi:peroxisomal acyl-coenzyme A oxidase 3-like [Cimex lectularius]|uniref:Acyl-coenzyme A oxidase n=1 Tax=Cimex lectularius TaxID=79782 RepID=A0A8I6RHJ2_CIMLE|nr:peroxisomal acyl-coenzyme A oxidase 3-like [Cimex lectularius]
MKLATMDTSVQDEQPGHLNYYRRKASFNLEDMKYAIENHQRLLIKNRVWLYLLSDPIFHPMTEPVSIHEAKKVTAQQLDKLLFSGLFDNVDNMEYAERTKFLMLVNEATEMMNCNLSIKFALGISLFSNTLVSLGTERHIKFYKDVWRGKILSCLCITEVEHGSDTKRLKTTATYDKNTKEFVLNTPGIGAAKCWIGNLGLQCTHALLFAQLISNGVCHGLHGFVVPVRDPDTRKPYKNITVGDIGEKAGLNGIDNGYIMFHNYRIPRENLLNRIGDINDDGDYETAYTDPQRLLGAALESLSAGRIGIIHESSNTLVKAIVIAIRYAAQRVQFSDSSGIELPIIEYQTHQWRLFPYLAASIAIKWFTQEFSDVYINFVAKSREGVMDVKQASQMASGLHAIVCCSKALITWTSQTAIQECREACGGHGYHKASGLGDLRNNHDPRVTFEGDNTVLLQQTSNWMLRIFTDSEADFSIFPLSNISFLKNIDSVLRKTLADYKEQDFMTIKFIIETYEWLICWLTKTTHEKISALKKFTTDRFEVRNLSQVFKARTLSLAFGEFNVIIHFKTKVDSCAPQLQPVLNKLGVLYGLWALYSHIPVLYQGGFSNDPKLTDWITDGILNLCQELKSEAVTLADAIAPPDIVLNSVLGGSDGKIYEKLMSAFTQESSANFVNYKSQPNKSQITSKL